jgi:hypothetical protein
MASEHGHQGSNYFWEAEECTGRSYEMISAKIAEQNAKSSARMQRIKD